MSRSTQALSKSRLGGRAGDAAFVIRKLVKDRAHHRSSAREKCFNAISNDGATLEEYVAAARRRGVRKDTAMGCLGKLLTLQHVAKRRPYRHTRH